MAVGDKAKAVGDTLKVAEDTVKGAEDIVPGVRQAEYSRQGKPIMNQVQQEMQVRYSRIRGSPQTSSQQAWDHPFSLENSP
jgi:hypothetical protein